MVRHWIYLYVHCDIYQHRKGRAAMTTPQPEQTVDEDLITLQKEFDMDEYGSVAENGHYLIKRVRQIVEDREAALNRQALATALRLIGPDPTGDHEIAEGVRQYQEELRQAFTDYYDITDEEEK